ncbi:hypothetical protein PAPYR_5511 [Paratrimastix pyriformis]|uniref:Peptidase M14 domain-containing protein n=1 Tax=Paratrimastix pyriformis TaxID=342808 RepID=A0ABQ8UHQ9_9EUKA|nr:hypothetical protein PAPYR_5511 [Paratrimastix pyriformis]
MLREHTVIHICPMLNPDGVLHGNGRCDALGKDLNRTWDNPDARKQPAIAALKRFLVKVDLYIDLHAHSGVMGGFVFANLPSSSRPLCGAVSYHCPLVAGAKGPPFTELSCTCLGESPLGFRSPHACISGRQRELTATCPACPSGWLVTTIPPFLTSPNARTDTSTRNALQTMSWAPGRAALPADSPYACPVRPPSRSLGGAPTRPQSRGILRGRVPLSPLGGPPVPPADNENNSAANLLCLGPGAQPPPPATAIIGRARLATNRHQRRNHLPGTSHSHPHPHPNATIDTQPSVCSGGPALCAGPNGGRWLSPGGYQRLGLAHAGGLRRHVRGYCFAVTRVRVDVVNDMIHFRKGTKKKAIAALVSTFLGFFLLHLGRGVLRSEETYPGLKSGALRSRAMEPFIVVKRWLSKNSYDYLLFYVNLGSDDLPSLAARADGGLWPPNLTLSSRLAH